MNLTEKLIRLWKKNSLTQLELAEKMDVTRQAISRWELGEALPSTDNLRRLSELFNVPVDYLMNDNASEPGTAVAVMERSEDMTKRNWRKPALVRAVIGLAIALVIIFVVGAFSFGYRLGVRDATPTYPVQSDTLNEEDFDEPGDLFGW